MRLFHFCCAVLHLASAFALLGLSVRGGKTLGVDVFWLYGDMTDLDAVTQTQKYTGTVPLTWLAILPAFVSGIAHFMIVVWYRVYAEMTPTIALFRWADYALSSPPMAVVLAALSGVWSAQTLVCVALLQFCTIMLGAASDFVKETPIPAFCLYLVAWIPCLGHILVSLVTFGTSVSESGDGAPLFVWAIVIGLNVLFASFGLLEGYVRTKGIGIVRQEYLYAILSLAAKTALHWLIWSGTQRDATLGAVAGGTTFVALVAALIVWRRVPADSDGYELLDTVD